MKAFAEMAEKYLLELDFHFTPGTARMEENGRKIVFSFMPDDPTGYVAEVDLVDMTWRHCGNSKGCFWTDWEKFTP